MRICEDPRSLHHSIPLRLLSEAEELLTAVSPSDSSSVVPFPYLILAVFSSAHLADICAAAFICRSGLGLAGEVAQPVRYLPSKGADLHLQNLY